MKRPLLTILGAALLFIVTAGIRPSYPEYIFLKDGKILQGTVIGDTGAGLTVRDKERRIQRIPRNTISRVIYTDLYLGKLYVRLTDGNSFLGFMVDEDANSYTFRKELQSPDEFRVRRKDVLFTARRNPTNLKATAGDDSVALKWHAPYNEVSDYKIYRKGPGDGEFKAVETSGDTEETVGDLKSSTTYKFYVTAIDDNDEESLPSDIVTVTTNNIPPERPGNLTATVEPEKTGTRMNVRLAWEKSEDPDGTVAHYAVYLRSQIGTRLQGKTQQTNYALQRLDRREEYDVIVRAVDNAGTESDDVALTITGGEATAVRRTETRQRETGTPGTAGGHISLSLYGSFLLPLHEEKFDRIANGGFGILVSGEYRNLFISGLSAGVETGYLYFTGDDDETKNIKRHMMVPLYPVVRYDLRVYDRFYVAPEAGFGMTWNFIFYNTIEGTQWQSSVTQSNRVLPLFTGGLAVSYRGFGRISITAGARYYGIIDPEVLIDFMMFYAGAGYSF
ncbi:MAG: fibronectin type III domain-containing protein [Spirochaetes bacterium]|nr:fibronectin type III domain-containing protein [Spirochaetota bacterium]